MSCIRDGRLLLVVAASAVAPATSVINTAADDQSFYHSGKLLFTNLPFQQMSHKYVKRLSINR